MENNFELLLGLQTYYMLLIWVLVSVSRRSVKAVLPTPNWVVWQGGQGSPDMRLA